MVGKDEIIICQWCNGKSTAKEWNDVTYQQCTSREMRRAFVDVYQNKSFSERADRYYMCPKCRRWLKGSQLIIDSDDEELKKLGRKPIIRINKQ